MKRQLFIIFAAFTVSCSKKDTMLPKDNVIEKKKKKEFVDSISGIYKNEFDSISECPITLNISMHNGKYFYNLETSTRNLDGSIYFISDGTHLVLKGIRWDKYNNEECKGDENEKDNPIGFAFLIVKNKLTLHNIGNTENPKNYYTVMGECGAEYIHLKK